MKPVKVLICVITQRVNVKLGNLDVDSVIRASSPFPKQLRLHKLAQLAPSQSEALGLQLRRPVLEGEGFAFDSEDSCEDFSPFTSLLLTVAVFILLLMFFAMLDVESGKSARSQKSLVQVVFVARTKVTPQNAVDNLRDTGYGKAKKALTSKVASAENGKSVEAKKGGNKNGHNPRGSGHGTFKLRNGFLMKKRRSSSGRVVKKTTTAKAIVQSPLVASLDLGRRALPVTEGNVSIVYKLLNKTGGEAAIFKPYEAIQDISFDRVNSEENKLTLNSKQNVLNEICAYKLDQLVADNLKAGVPETQHVKLPVALFSNENQEKKYIQGSLQKFVPNAENCEDYGSNLFSKDDVHRIGILDLRILNCDRHTGNLLFNSSTKRLTPIDHALSFPTIDFDVRENAEQAFLDKDVNNLSLANVSFDWMMFPQAKLPFSDELIEAIKSLDVVKDLEIMKKLNMSVKQRLAVFVASTLLKKGVVEYNKTLYELGSVAQRTGARTSPSVLEQLSLDAVEKVDRTQLEAGNEEQVKLFCAEFSSLLDDYFKV